MNELYTALRDAGEFYAAELVVNTGREPLYRYSRAAAAFLRMRRFRRMTEDGCIRADRVWRTTAVRR